MVTRLGPGTAIRVIALGAILIAACSPAAESPEAPVVVDTAASSELPEEVLVAETVYIEGVAEIMQVRRFESPIDFPLGFYTRVPADMAIAFGSTGEGDEVRFEANFGGIRRTDARLGFVALDEGMAAAEARDTAASVARQLGGVPVTGDRAWSWATDEFRLQGDEVGFLATGEHRDVWFYIVAAYPPEFGDGMAPRIDLIIRNWIWADDGTRLVPE